MLSTITTTVSMYGYRATIKMDALNQGNTLYVNADNVTIDGLVIDGNSKTQKGLILSINRNNVTVRNCEIKNIKQAGSATSETVGLGVFGGSSNIRIENNHVHDCDSINSGGTGICRGILIGKNSTSEADSTNIWVVNNRVADITSTTGVEATMDSDGIVVQGHFAGADANTFTGGTANIHILNNHLLRCQKRGIKSQSPGVSISGNIVEMHTTRLGFAGITITTPQDTISNNIITMYRTVTAGIEVLGAQGGVTTWTNQVVTGNTVRFGTTQTDVDGIRAFYYAKGLTISNNHVHGGRYGIRFQSTGKGIICNDNMLHNQFYAGILLEAVSGAYPISVVVSGNLFNEGATNGFEMSGPATNSNKVVVTGNGGNVNWSIVELNAATGVVTSGNGA